MTLVTFTQIDSGIITAHAREIGSAPLRVDETQDINVVLKATRHARHTQDRLSTFESCSLHSRLSAVLCRLSHAAGKGWPPWFHESVDYARRTACTETMLTGTIHGVSFRNANPKSQVRKALRTLRRDTGSRTRCVLLWLLPFYTAQHSCTTRSATKRMDDRVLMLLTS